jgi:hypothetical protein
MSLNNFMKIVVGEVVPALCYGVMISAGGRTKLKDEQELCISSFRSYSAMTSGMRMLRNYSNSLALFAGHCTICRYSLRSRRQQPLYARVRIAVLSVYSLRALLRPSVDLCFTRTWKQFVLWLVEGSTSLQFFLCLQFYALFESHWRGKAFFIVLTYSSLV